MPTSTRRKAAAPATIDFRQIILARLDTIGRTINWLAERQKAVHPNGVREYLYGYERPDRQSKTREPLASTLAELMRVVGLRIVSAKGYKVSRFD